MNAMQAVDAGLGGFNAAFAVLADALENGNEQAPVDWRSLYRRLEADSHAAMASMAEDTARLADAYEKMKYARYACSESYKAAMGRERALQKRLDAALAELSAIKAA